MNKAFSVLVTGAKGFLGKHTCLWLRRKGYEVFEFDLGSTEEELNEYVSKADFIIHLAGINRPLKPEEFYDGNANFTKHLIDKILEKGRKTPLIFSSSIQAALDNDYGKSKKQAEDFLFGSGLPVYVYRLANVYGKWCRPNYNSAAATFCYNIAHGLPIEIRDRNYVVHYNFVEDIVFEFLKVVDSYVEGASIEPKKEVLYVNPTDDCSLGRLADLLYGYKEAIESKRHLPALKGGFELKLFKTFCDYLSDEGYAFNYAKDDRGYFEEIYKSEKWGQISINMAYPGITKGGHYHTYKKEIFYPVVGSTVIRQRNIKTNEMLVDKVDENNSRPVDIIPEYTHEISNVGDKESLTVMWISKIYDPNTHDTYRMEVEP